MNLCDIIYNYALYNILAYKKKTDNLDVLLNICWHGRQHGEQTKHI
jgi:hypothetical protein